MSRTIAKAAVVAAVAGTMHLAPALPAHAQASGFGCVLRPITTIGDLHIDEVQGGPLVADESGVEVQMRCTIQVGSANSTHAGTDADFTQGPTLPQLGIVPPSDLTYDAVLGTPIYLCSQARIDGFNHYLDATTGNWSTSDGVSCRRIVSSGNPALDIVDEVFVGIVDPTICEPLGSMAPGWPPLLSIDPTGDIRVLGNRIWNCPPYNS